MNALEAASLVMIPSGYENGTLGSLKPTDGTGDFTFSRGSDISATRVNEDGYIEKGYENLLLQSNSFDTTWTTQSASVTSGQAGYDGTNDAWILDKSAFAGQVKQSISVSGVNTLSVYLKAGTLNFVRIITSTGVVSVTIDLSNGVFAAVSGGIISKNIESSGNGFYKVSISFVESIGLIGFIPQESLSVLGVSGSIYIQDAQINQGLVAYPYVETTTAPVAGGILEDMPRLDYSGSCPALLLEPQRTNLAEKSEYIGGWSFPTNVTLTQNYGISPEGLTNSTRLQFTSNGFMNDALSQVSGTQYTLSIYAKRNDGGTQSFGFYVDGTPTIVGGITLTSDWQRFTYTYTASNSFSIGLAGNSGADVSVYGFQLEQDATYPTSYIPTNGTSQTRLQELGRSGDYIDTTITFAPTDDFSIFYDGELFEIEVMIFGGGSSSLDAGRLWILGNEIRIDGTTPSVTLMANTSISIDLNTRFKLLVKRNGATIDFFLDGSKLTTTQGDTDATFVINSLFWSYSNNYTAYGKHNQALVFPTALSDDECIELTTI